MSQRLRPTGSGWMVDRADGVLGAGPRFEGDLSPIVFHLLTLCRGHFPLSDVLAQAAARAGTDVETIREECLDAVRTLVLQGFLRPVDPALGPVDASGATR